ncbi:TPA: ead/Ea22-like family protein [Klebsiella oxytoca]|uniref:ead/Ea22-like family protein n=1 Tax=Klebsiella oxytoca TaxID=571 RepID=UPI003752610F
MTDITELAQREKFEAWWEREYKHLESSKYTDAVPHIKYGFWMAYQAGGAELVEALESEKRICATWRKTAESTSEKLEKAQTINAAAEKLVRCKGRYHSEQNYRALAALFGVNTPDLPPLEHENVHYADAADMEIEALRQRIAELEREQEQLRPVGVMSEKAFHRLENSECRFIALWPRPGIFLPRKRPEDGVIVYARTAAAAGIKWEAE